MTVTPLYGRKRVGVRFPKYIDRKDVSDYTMLKPNNNYVIPPKVKICYSFE